MFHKPSHEPYFLPFKSVHVNHIKKNIPFVALTRALRYCSSYDAFEREEAHICMSLLFNKYPMHFILKQFERVFKTFQRKNITEKDFLYMRRTFLNDIDGLTKKSEMNFDVVILCHFFFCKGMHDFPTQFHQLWDNCFSDTAISNMKPIIGTKRL